MHVPTPFQQHDADQLKQIILEYPFATLITHSEHGLEANHIPFILEQKDNTDILCGHIATANPLWKHMADTSDVLVVFNGPHCYISPNHYPTKKEHGKAVPTWNYIAVHVKGTLSFIRDAAWNIAMLEKLTQHQESSQETPWSINDAPDAYIQKMLPAIIGIEITISSITGQWKVSQNQPEKNQHGVLEGLSAIATQTTDEQKIAAFIHQSLAKNKQ
jgi:transcriptional regulator